MSTPPSVNDLFSQSLWPTTLFARKWSHHPMLAPAIIRHLYGLRDQQSQTVDSGVDPRAKSASGVYESHFDLFKDPSPELQELVKFIATSVAEAVLRMTHDPLTRKDIDVDFVDSWYHITNDGGFHDAHFHHGCSWCGIYYLRLADSGRSANGGAPNGGSRFYSPIRCGGAHFDYGAKYLSDSIDPPISDGMLLLFPSYLLHSGLPYTGSEDRVLVAFNSRVYLTPEAAARLDDKQ